MGGKSSHKRAKKRQNSEDKAELIQFNSKGNTFFASMWQPTQYYNDFRTKFCIFENICERVLFFRLLFVVMWLLGKKVFNRNSVIYYHDKNDNSYLKLSMKTKENIDVIKKYYLKEFTFFDGENDVIFNIVGLNFEK